MQRLRVTSSNSPDWDNNNNNNNTVGGGGTRRAAAGGAAVPHPPSLPRSRSNTPDYPPAARRRARGGSGTGTGGVGGGGGGFLTRQTFLTLVIGMSVGYILLPVLLVEMDIDYLMQSLPDPGDHPLVQKWNVPPGSLQQDGGGGLRPVASDADKFQPRSLDSPPGGGGSGSAAAAAGISANELADIEKRLREDRDLMSKQSIQTATTPYVMKTATLPDHQRLKILVTGGAGFVGSHLVDKLMMEGHEVIVVDNFFTGQKKNIAHWLHHPNFR